jgi:CheY-like chemotaxis protein
MSVSILVVDDEPDVAELFRQRFRREVRQDAYVMHFADSGEEGLEPLLGHIGPFLMAVPSDINTAGMDGLQLLGEIRQRCPDLPMMVAIAMETMSDATKPASELGSAQFQPVDFDLLKEQLSRFPPRSGNKTAR